MQESRILDHDGGDLRKYVDAHERRATEYEEAGGEITDHDRVMNFVDPRKFQEVQNHKESVNTLCDTKFCIFSAPLPRKKETTKLSDRCYLKTTIEPR